MKHGTVSRGCNTGMWWENWKEIWCDDSTGLYFLLPTPFCSFMGFSESHSIFSSFIHSKCIWSSHFRHVYVILMCALWDMQLFFGDIGQLPNNYALIYLNTYTFQYLYTNKTTQCCFVLLFYFSNLQLSRFCDPAPAVAADSCSGKTEMHPSMVSFLLLEPSQFKVQCIMCFEMPFCPPRLWRVAIRVRLPVQMNNSGHSSLISHIDTFHSTLKHSCFCMNLSMSGRHLIIDACSLTHTKSQQLWDWVEPWGSPGQPTTLLTWRR